MGNTFGQLFRVTTWGESHGPATGAVVDGCPSRLPLSELDIQPAGVELACAHCGHQSKVDHLRFDCPVCFSNEVEVHGGEELELIAGAAEGYFGALSRPAIVLLTLVIFGSFTAAMVAGLFGMVMAPPADRRAHALLLLVIGLVCLVHTVTFGHSRYHLPLMPIVLLYAGSAVAHARALWARRAGRSFWLAAGLSGAFVLGRLWEISVVDGERYWNLLRALG